MTDKEFPIWTYELHKHAGDVRFCILFSLKDGQIAENELVPNRRVDTLVQWYKERVGDRFFDNR